MTTPEPVQAGRTDPVLPAWLAARLAGGAEHFVVTGASGWFGRTTLELLRHALGPAEAERRVVALASTAKAVVLRDGSSVTAHPFAELAARCPPEACVLHYAFPTRDRVAALGAPAFTAMAASITLAVASLVESGRVAALFVTSSGAVYKPGGGLADDLEANPYGAAKHLDELALLQACGRAGTTAVVTRVFSVSGPYMTRPHIYALGDLIAQVRAGGPVLVRSAGPVRRSYVAVTDLVALALSQLADPVARELVLDGAGEEVVEVGQLARRVGTALGRGHVEVVRSLDTSAKVDDYVGDPSTLLGLAKDRQFELTNLDDQIRATAAWLAASEAEPGAAA